MLIWLILTAVSIFLGAIVSYIPGKWSWLLIIPTPFLLLYLLIHLMGSKDPFVLVLYFNIGLPSVIVVLISWYLMRYYRRQK